MQCGGVAITHWQSDDDTGDKHRAHANTLSTVEGGGEIHNRLSEKLLIQAMQKPGSPRFIT